MRTEQKLLMILRDSLMNEKKNERRKQFNLKK